MFIFIILTLVAAFAWHSILLCALFAVGQFLACGWYCLSYIPFARYVMAGLDKKNFYDFPEPGQTPVILSRRGRIPEQMIVRLWGHVDDGTLRPICSIRVQSLSDLLQNVGDEVCRLLHRM